MTATVVTSPGAPNAGFARTGDLFVCDHEGIAPDQIVTAKGAGGLRSAITGRAEIIDAPQADGLTGRAREIERLLKDRLGTIRAEDPLASR